MIMPKTHSMEPLLNFLNNSPTPWHAVESSKKLLSASGFEELDESSEWQLQPGHKYFIIRDGSTLCAFIAPKNIPKSARVIGTHTDSPGYKLKPHAEYCKENMIMLGLEIYGGPLLTSWMNRDLGIAGRVAYLNNKNTLELALVNLKNAPVVIPQLAIHLDRQVNENGLLINKQEQLAAIAGFADGDNLGFLYSHIKNEIPELKTILSTDLFLYPLEPARCLGRQNELIAAYKLDNLCSVHAGVEALKEASPLSDELQILICWDHEEIGSSTANGAASPFFQQVLERITLALKLSRTEYLSLMSQSFCVSVDLVHALHPNYGDKHEPRHPVLMKKGIVIKFSAQQKYASNAHSSARILELCNQLDIPYQFFVNRGDIAGGTTIGPIHASQTGMATVDIGIGQLSMHSCRELAACQDYQELKKLLKGYYS